jgi:methenyltetrahydrofolate cyclohydrolase
MINKSVKEFSEALASKAAVPGGGGASALAGALGAALGDMVGELTVGKKKYADVEPIIRELMAQAQTLREELLACIGKDAEAFEPLSKAYGIPKDDPTRAEVMENCLRAAAAPPMEIMELSAKTLDLLRGFADMGSKLAISDAATGAAMSRAALYGAAMNVRVNTAAMQDREYAAKVNARVDALIEQYGALADTIFQDVYGRFC